MPTQQGLILQADSGCRLIFESHHHVSTINACCVVTSDRSLAAASSYTFSFASGNVNIVLLFLLLLLVLPVLLLSVPS